MGNSEKYGKTFVTLGAQNCQESRFSTQRSLNRNKVEQKVPLPLPYFATLMLLWSAYIVYETNLHHKWNTI